MFHKSFYIGHIFIHDFACRSVPAAPAVCTCGLNRGAAVCCAFKRVGSKVVVDPAAPPSSPIVEGPELTQEM